MNLDLSGKNALVCGSTQGIGYAAAVELARLGARLVLCARNETKLQEVCLELEAINPIGHSYICADFSEPRALEAKLGKDLRGVAIHILVNNTGGPPPGKAIESDITAFQAAFEMHLLCNHLLVQACLPGMREAGYGRIINVISTSVKQPLPNLGVSNTIRGAVANWAKTLSMELGPMGITVNNVLPGATETGRLEAIASRKAKAQGTDVETELARMAEEVPLKRLAKAEEIAAGIAFLASPAAGYINGINLPIDGGRTGSL